VVVWLSILTLPFPAFGTDRYASSQPLGVITAYDCIDYLDAQPKMQYVNAPKTSSSTQPNSSNIHQTGSEHGPGTSSPLYILTQRKTLQRSHFTVIGIRSSLSTFLLKRRSPKAEAKLLVK
jgi:hypothetical protein